MKRANLIPVENSKQSIGIEGGDVGICTHSRIERKQKRYEAKKGVFLSEWWQCQDCKMEFIPLSTARERTKVAGPNLEVSAAVAAALKKAEQACEGDSPDENPDSWSWHKKDYVHAIRALSQTREHLDAMLAEAQREGARHYAKLNDAHYDHIAVCNEDCPLCKYIYELESQLARHQAVRAKGGRT